jgi:hypothetical protein
MYAKSYYFMLSNDHFILLFKLFMLQRSNSQCIWLSGGYSQSLVKEFFHNKKSILYQI